MATVSAPERPITERSALTLAAAIRAGDLTSREVVDAHIARIEADNPSLNAVVATRFEAARTEADAADARATAADGGDELPPFLGVPLTVKESFALAGMPNSSGLGTRREVIASENATAVDRLIAAGAIPLGVTNLSELTLWIEATNPIYGRTNNAHDPRRTAGGSSGGEGAAVGAGFAPIGLGTDFGGSIRLPAFFNGAFGHKPTGCLVPHTGHYPAPNDHGSRMLGVGPLTRSAEDLMPFLRAIAGPDGVDASVREVELGDPAEVSLEGLRVVISDDASILPVSLELRNARIRAAKALRAVGADVRRVSLPGIRTVIQPYLTAARDSGAVREILGGEGDEVPGFTRLLADAIRGRSRYSTALLLTMAGESLSPLLPHALDRRAAAATRSLAAEIEDVIGDGVLLHPPFSKLAPKHGRTVGRPWVLAPTAVFNLLGLPVTQVPLGLNERGLPLGVQVVAGRDRDHVAIAVALELERAFGGWVPPARSRRG